MTGSGGALDPGEPAVGSAPPRAHPPSGRRGSAAEELGPAPRVSIGRAMAERPGTSAPSRGRWRPLLLGGAVLVAAAAALTLSVRQIYFVGGTQFAAVVEPPSRVELNFPTLGRLAELRVAPSARVHAGQLLAEQTTGAAQSAVAADQAGLLADRQRLAALQLATPVNAASVASARAQVSRDVAALAAANAELASLRLVSPVNGVVVSVGGAVGDLVGSSGVSSGADPATQVPTGPTSPFFPPPPSSQVASGSSQGAPLFIVDGQGRWQAVAQVPEGDVRGVERDRRAAVTIDALGGPPVAARLIRVVPDPVLVGGATYYDVAFRLARAPGGLLPGMTASVVVSR